MWIWRGGGFGSPGSRSLTSPPLSPPRTSALSVPGACVRTPLLPSTRRRGTSDTNDETSSCCVDIVDANAATEMHNSPLASVLQLVNVAIAAGLLVQPYVFQRAGVAVAVAEYVAVNGVIYMGVEVLMVAAARVGTFDYADLAVVAFGPVGELYVDISIVLGMAGVVVVNILLVGALFQDVERTYLPTGGDGSWYYNMVFDSEIVVCVVVVPLCLFRNFGHLAMVSAFSFVVITSTVLLVLVYGPMEAPTHAADVINWGDGVGAFTSLGSVVFNFVFSMSAFHAYVAMEAPAVPSAAATDGGEAGKAGTVTDASDVDVEATRAKVELFLWVTAAATVAGVVLSLMIGLVGYLSFRDATQLDILANIPGNAGAAFKILFSAYLVLYVPLSFMMLRHAALNICGVNVSDLPTPSFVLATASVLSCLLAVSFALQRYCPSSTSLSVVLDLTGGVTGSAISFLLPGAIGLALVPPAQQRQSKGPKGPPLAADVLLAPLTAEPCRGGGGGDVPAVRAAAAAATEAAAALVRDRGAGVDLDRNGARWIRAKSWVLVVVGVVVPLLVIASTTYSLVAAA